MNITLVTSGWNADIGQYAMPIRKCPSEPRNPCTKQLMGTTSWVAISIMASANLLQFVIAMDHGNPMAIHDFSQLLPLPSHWRMVWLVVVHRSSRIAPAMASSAPCGGLLWRSLPWARQLPWHDARMPMRPLDGPAWMEHPTPIGLTSIRMGSGDHRQIVTENHRK